MKKAFVAFFLLAMLVAFLFVKETAERDKILTSTAVPSSALQETGDGVKPLPARSVNAGSEDVRRQQMQESYRQLQALRRELQSHANLIKSRIWGLQLPATQARHVSGSLREAYAYLKNPALLGAYADAEAISVEIRRVQAMQASLQKVDSILAAARASAH